MKQVLLFAFWLAGAIALAVIALTLCALSVVGGLAAGCFGRKSCGKC